MGTIYAYLIPESEAPPDDRDHRANNFTQSVSQSINESVKDIYYNESGICDFRYV